MASQRTPGLTPEPPTAQQRGEAKTSASRTSRSRDDSLAAIILAAGRSTRFGSPKMLARLAGRPVLRHTAEHVIDAGIDNVIVVVPPEAAAFAEALDGLDVRSIANPDPGRGLSSSIRTGIDALPPSVREVLLVLGDQPTIASDILRALFATHRASRHPVTIADYGGVLAPPAIFDRSIFADLLALEGDHGARRVVAKYPDRVTRVPFDSMPPDIDTPEDLVRLQAGFVDG